MNVLKSYANRFVVFILSTAFAANAAPSQGSNGASSEQVATITKSAQPALASPTGDAVLPMLLSLLFIMAVIFAIAWVAKKLNLTPNNTGHFKLVSSMSLGGRERVVIIEVQGQQHAIGVTSQSVNHLFQLDKNIEPARQPMANNALLQRLNKVFGYTPPGGAVKSNE